MANSEFSRLASHMWTLECKNEMTLQEISSQLTRIANTIGRFPLLFLDYLQRIPLAKDGYILASAERTSLVMYDLHQIAREFKVPVIVSAFEDDRYPLPDAVEAASDVLMHLEFRQESQETTPVPVSIRIAKNGNGDIGTVPLFYHFCASTFCGGYSLSEPGYYC